MSAHSVRAARTRPTLELAKVGVAVVLTFVAGYVDAIGWLALDRVFTAQMSGNLVLLAVHIVADERGRAWLQADAIIAFFVGLVATGSLIEMGMRCRWRRIFVAALIVEFLLLICFTAAGSALLPAGGIERESADWPTYALIAVVALAMGAQNTSLRMAGILSVYTTQMTGTLTGLSEEIIVCAYSLLRPENYRKRRGGFSAARLQEKHPAAFRNIGQSIVLLIAFFAGAMAGAATLKPAGLAFAMGVPLAVLIAIGVLDWRVPLTVFPSPAEQE